jgi:hypothetical protein
MIAIIITIIAILATKIIHLDLFMVTLFQKNKKGMAVLGPKETSRLLRVPATMPNLSFLKYK